VDIVSVASYDNFHHDQIRRAIEDGKHVFAEKPLVLSEEHARDIHRLLRAHPEVQLSTNVPLRRSPRFMALRDRVGAGELGRLYYLEADYEYGRIHKIVDGWRGELPFYSVVLGGGVHVVDLLLWLTGDRVTEVTAYGNRIATEDTKFRYDDLVAALLRFESGVVAKVTCNFASVHPHFHSLELWGTDGSFINGLDSGTLWRRSPDGPVESRVNEPYPGVHKGALIHEFVESILGRGPSPVTSDEVFDALSVCFAIDASAVRSEPVRVEPFE
jgi:predicted dehydrogenase